MLVAFEPVIIFEHEAVIGGFKCLYHLTRKEQAHHTNYADLLELAELLGCHYFEKLKVNVNACLSLINIITKFVIFNIRSFVLFKIGKKTNYTSHRIVDEMLTILITVVEEPILKSISASVAIGLEVDETTDVSVKKQLDVHVRYNFIQRMSTIKTLNTFERHVLLCLICLFVHQIHGQGGTALQPISGPGDSQRWQS